ncbi:hypothetical protein Z517_12369 [Fonsecaea pedrosoi CBS 271.37]|uniref:Uncharacterized protein n=1 Tax=Fonsecaea pedrosoi CBS 271.37 TaxID=1442368 RepID=A0A0D2GPV7_9EURO|nr:uncharacterized protein Z517_12369 [Fonsecaea pedrosoi CBS 271.37]KIW74429.1 hypothetical protein Z517_12369 [Fonsecaea pedrosoi CBS 271.37]
MFSAEFSGARNPSMGVASILYSSRGLPVDQGEPASEQSHKKEDYESIQRKRRAEMILAQYDLLMKYAVENNLSIPQTRQYFRKVALGIPTEPIIKNWFPS